jgi:hypothetical protein
MRTRWTLEVWEIDGNRYAIRRDDSGESQAEQTWARLARAKRLPITLDAGCAVRELKVVGGILARCRAGGLDVFMSLHCVEGWDEN